MSNKNIGTCPACFQPIALNAKGEISRHGWKVVGNRQVGQYHQTWHSGPCFGTGYEPFEVSSKGSVDYFWNILIPAGTRNLKVISHLDTRPDLIITAASRKTYYVNGTRSYGEKPVQALYSIRLVPGDVDVKGEKDLYAKEFSYEEELETQVKAAAAERAAILETCALFCDKVSEWKPQGLAVKAPKPVKPTHLRRNGRYSVCGVTHSSMNGRCLAPVSIRLEDVTCEACKAKAV